MDPSTGMPVWTLRQAWVPAVPLRVARWDDGAAVADMVALALDDDVDTHLTMQALADSQALAQGRDAHEDWADKVAAAEALLDAGALHPATLEAAEEEILVGSAGLHRVPEEAADEPSPSRERGFRTDDWFVEATLPDSTWYNVLAAGDYTFTLAISPAAVKGYGRTLAASLRGAGVDVLYGHDPDLFGPFLLATRSTDVLVRHDVPSRWERDTDSLQRL